jgi:hypothetical protein
MRSDRWETGSDYQWVGWPAEVETSVMPWSSGRLLFSGRDALRMTLTEGVRHRGWRRLWVPEYYCQVVTAALVRDDLRLQSYPDSPDLAGPARPELHRGDAILVMNYFGIRGRIDIQRPEGVDVVEDHSHDPTSDWALTSTADFCIASLRKTLPLTDGGVLWSPKGHDLPGTPGLDQRRRRAASTRLTGMMLKSLYLAGAPIEKSGYRGMIRRGEAGLSYPSVTKASDLTVAFLASYPIERWRRARQDNFTVILESLATVGWAEILRPGTEAGAPFSCVLILDTAERRQRLRDALIQHRIFPAVLWPLESPVLTVGSHAVDISRRLISLHCDGRYGPDDMRRVASLVRQLGDS